MNKYAFAFVIPSVLLSSTAFADAPYRHGGFSLRLAGGVGYLTVAGTEDTTESRIRGGAGTFALAIGGAFRENLIFHGEMIGISAPNPSVGSKRYDRGRDGYMNAFGIGPGATYYFMPINLYISGSILLTELDYDFENDDPDHTNWGAGFHFMVGKEWWVAKDWGIGVAGSILGGHVGDRYTDGAWNFASFSVMFSATYN